MAGRPMPSYTCVSGRRVGWLPEFPIVKPNSPSTSVCLSPEAVLSRVTAIYNIPTFTMPLATLISSAVPPHTCATMQCIWDYLFLLLLSYSTILSQHPPSNDGQMGSSARGPQQRCTCKCRGMVRLEPALVLKEALRWLLCVPCVLVCLSA